MDEWESREEPCEPRPAPVPHDMPELRDGREWYPGEDE